MLLNDSLYPSVEYEKGNVACGRPDEVRRQTEERCSTIGNQTLTVLLTSNVSSREYMKDWRAYRR